jgi:hypothetical protein
MEGKQLIVNKGINAESYFRENYPDIKPVPMNKTYKLSKRYWMAVLLPWHTIIY